MAELRILAGIPCYKPFQEFLRDSRLFLDQCSLKYEIKEYWVYGKSLVDAQNEIADYAIKNNFTHILFLEDDHSGHKPEMLDALLKPNTYVSAIKYYSRWPLFLSTLMNVSGMDNSGNYKYVEVMNTSGYSEVDLCGFGLTLVRSDTFNHLEKPYFRVLDKSIDGRGVATDRDFFKRLSQSGIRPVGCFDYVLNHRDINETNILTLRFNHLGNRKRKLLRGAYVRLQRAKRINRELKTVP